MTIKSRKGMTRSVTFCTENLAADVVQRIIHVAVRAVASIGPKDLIVLVHED